ncbi:MAG TPA: alpha/beta fold hydrolase [Candidatus Blautia excrementipullorum]|nr:alpha/beta fold hydrolase [Candidatus Blautia excrementipullorum]
MRQKRGMTAAVIAVLAVFFLVAAYNMYRFPARFRNLSDESLTEEQVSALKDELAEKESKKTLVAYFSYSGTTKSVAEALSGRIGADLFEITPKEEYSNVYMQSNSEIRRNARPELARTVENMEEYDIVFVGYPVWWHAVPAPVNTFLESYDLTGKLIIPFCTSGGSDIEETMPTFLDSCKNLAVYGESRITGTSQIDNWLTDLDLNFDGGSEEQADEEEETAENTVYSYQSQELYASRGGNQIYGVIYIPQNAGEKMPAVIFSHGFGGNYQAGIQYAEALAERGYVVYCFDFCGGSPGSRSGGSPLEMSLFTEEADLEAVMEMVKKLDYVDRDILFLMGTSQGGAVSAVTGADHEEEIRGMILLYPAFVLADRANELFQSVDEISDTYYFMWMEVGRAYFEPLIGYDIYSDIAGYEKDVLLIHGDRDSIVPFSYSEQAIEAYPSAELEVIPGAGHGFYGEEAQLALGYIFDYLENHLV